MKKLFVLCCVLAFAIPITIGKVIAQQPTAQAGPVIEGFGKTREVPNPDLKTNTELTFKAVFDVWKAPEDPSKLNKNIETIARFLNMHARAGVPVEQLHVRMAIHGPASYGLLKNEHYKAKFGVDNPNIELLQAIDDVGVEILLCGQTAGSRNISKERRLPLTKTALSAMTILIQSQEEGYNLIAF